MTKRYQCSTCVYTENGKYCKDCDTCAMHSDKPLKSASHAVWPTCNCKCITVEYDEECPYYKEAHRG